MTSTTRSPYPAAGPFTGGQRAVLRLRLRLASLSFDLEFPPCAADAVTWLERTWPPLRKVLDHPACDVDGSCQHNNGERWPLHRIFTTLITEQVHHGAEISLLRDLYRVRDTEAMPD
jgi:hypothetical protein